VEVKNGRLTGILVDNAIGLVRRAVPAASREETVAGLKAAE
jgi:predicted amidohydrolase YtcJ